ncbi:Gfo/Idh/MocA family oxidoreductase [Capnocytophaga ochracea]|uniref:Gfo/Idh/MocA family protein n=1 Tax=Capnocytophaga TaxID=1016 RepID=UPI0006AED6C5|nr:MULTISPECIES: Gfo/Idh/MocA family oxidoreductase [Capnocytophaga]ALC97465.1 oxidoreductase [Capnocytophaga sp. oral taxon 323]MEB3015449.1 Gfo/Idh/MocA family oxidoreductase [Capnocytophaga ochracea]MEB3035530.1 Gfo/Idh/MocA family oxidoreductase [Capnocytophaga ochracea]
MKVLIIGLGSIALKHIKALQELYPSVVIYALRRKGEPSKGIKGVIEIFDMDEIAVDTLSFILISNPTAVHYDTIQKVIRYKKPLFIEKPLFGALSKEANDLVMEVGRQGILTYVACNLRFLESIVKIKNLLIGKRVNEVNVYCGSYLPDWRPNVDFRKVYSANKEMGGGVHIDLIHELDYVYWLFGVPIHTQSFFSNKSSLNITAYDYANYLWEYDDFSVSVVLNYYRRESKRTLEVLTEEGTYLVDLLKNTISYNDKLVFQSSQLSLQTYTAQMQFFVEEILNKQTKFNTIVEANKILELCLQE